MVVVEGRPGVEEEGVVHTVPQVALGEVMGGTVCKTTSTTATTPASGPPMSITVQMVATPPLLEFPTLATTTPHLHLTLPHTLPHTLLLTLLLTLLKVEGTVVIRMIVPLRKSVISMQGDVSYSLEVVEVLCTVVVVEVVNANLRVAPIIAIARRTTPADMVPVTEMAVLPLPLTQLKVVMVPVALLTPIAPTLTSAEMDIVTTCQIMATDDNFTDLTSIMQSKVATTRFSTTLQFEPRGNVLTTV